MHIDLKNIVTPLTLGIDVGSTTAKLALIRAGEVICETYERHFSCIRETVVKMLESVRGLAGNEKLTAAVSGSAGMGLAEGAEIPFVQEVWGNGRGRKKCRSRH